MPGGGQPLDPNRMAAQEFDPQYELLSRLATQAKSRYTKSATDARSAYDSLAQSIRHDGTAIGKQYDNTGKQITGAYNDSTKALEGVYNRSRNDTADLLQRLGIQQAAPQVFSDQNKALQRSVGTLQANSNNFTNTNRALKSSTLDYNRSSAQNANMAGLNASNDYKSQLNDVLNGFGNQRLQLKGQERSTANQYGMSIAQMEQAAALQSAKMQMEKDIADQKARVQAEGYKATSQKNYNDYQLRLKQMLLNDQNTDYSNETNRSRAELALSQFQSAQQRAKADAAHADQTKMDPYQLLASRAKTLYATPTARANAIKAVTDTLTDGWRGDTQIDSLGKFLQFLELRNRNASDLPKLNAMATAFYQQIK